MDLPSEELIAKVKAELNDDSIRPLCDTVVVRAPNAVEYQVAAVLDLLDTANVDDVLVAAEKAWEIYQAGRFSKLGVDVVPLEVQMALKVSGVYDVRIDGLSHIKVAQNEWAKCVGFRLTIGERTNG